MKACKLINLLPCILVAWMSIAPSPIYASVTEYQSPDVDAKEYSADCNVIYKQTYDFSEDIPKYPEDLNISVSGYDGIYDEKPHGIMVSASTEGCKILYSEDGKNYSQTKPTYTDVGIYTTYYRVEINGAIVHEGHQTIKISAADINYVAGDYNGTYDGKLHGIYMSVLSNGCKVLYSVDGVTFSLKKPEYKDSGTYVVYYKITGDNYKTVTGNNKIIIKDKNSESIIDYVTGDYNGVYDGKPHGIFVKAFTEGCEILYSEDGIHYSPKNPEYKDPGTYVVYYKIMKDNYTTVTGNNKIIIRESDAKPTIDYVVGDYNGVYDGEPHGIYVKVFTEGCEILYSEDGIHYSPKNPEYKDPGTYVVYYKITKDNYTTATGSNKVVIQERAESSIDYVAGDYHGVDDGKPHGIFVKAFTEDCEILYSEDGINYSLHNPEYTEPGTYVVYYKIVKDNYTTVTGSNKVIIRAKDSTINKDHNSNNDNSGNSSYNNSNNYMPNKNAGASNVQTGDGSNLFLYIVLMVVSVFGMTIWKRRGRRE